MIKKTIELTEKQDEKLNRYKEITGITPSNCIRFALKDFFEKNNL